MDNEAPSVTRSDTASWTSSRAATAPGAAGTGGFPRRGPGGRLLLVAAIVAVALSTLSVFQSWGAYDRDRDAVVAAAEDRARAGAADANRYLRDRLDLLAVMAAAPVVASGDLAAIRGYLVSVGPADLGFSHGLGLVDLQGRLVASSDLEPGTTPIALAAAPYVRTVLADGNPYVSAAVPSSRDGEPVIALAVPVRDATGAVSGVFVGEMGLEWLRAIAARQPHGADSVLEIVDRDGRLIASPRETDLRDVSGVSLTQRTRAPATDPTASGVLVDVMGLMDEPGRLVAYANAPVSDWLFLIERPIAGAFGDAFRTLVLELGAIGVVALLALGGAIWAGSRLNRLAAAEQAATTALRETEVRFRTLATHAPVGIFRTDPRGQTVYVNPAWTEITGLDASAASGLGWSAAVHPDDRARVDADWQAAIAAGGASRGEFRFVTGTGAVAWVSGQADPERDATGAVVAWVGTLTDITERKRAEEVRRAFLDGLAHDLKNPLSTVKAQSQLLRRRIRRDDSPGPDALEAGLGAIDVAATRMNLLIDEMLAVEREGAGQALALTRTRVDLVALAAECIAAQRQATVRHEIRLDSAVDGDPLVGEWDRRRLERAVANLLANAVKYSPDGGAITVAVRPDTDGDRTWAVLSVRDEGVGIPDVDVPRVFERYFRGGNVSEWTAGSGLGLTGVRQIVAEHGGTVGVESREGHGTSISIRLPMDRSASYVPNVAAT